MKNFDLKDLVYVPTTAPTVPAPPGEGVRHLPTRPRKGHFVKVPLEWVARLSAARLAATWKVALHLLHESFKNRRQTIRLANGAVALDGISKCQKWRALAELEGLGLVSIEHRPRRSPDVTLLYPPEGG